MARDKAELRDWDIWSSYDTIVSQWKTNWL